MIIKEQSFLHPRDVYRFCNSILNLMGTQIGINTLFDNECEPTISYDVEADSTVIEQGFNRLYAEDFDIDTDFYRERK